MLGEILDGRELSLVVSSIIGEGCNILPKQSRRTCLNLLWLGSHSRADDRRGDYECRHGCELVITPEVKGIIEQLKYLFFGSNTL